MAPILELRHKVVPADAMHPASNLVIVADPKVMVNESSSPRSLVAASSTV